MGDAGALAGSQVLAVQGADAAWELLSFSQAELIGPGTWRLARLLRGLAGSEAQASRLAPPGSRAVLIDGALEPLYTAPEDIGSHAYFRISAAGRDHADPGALSFDHPAGNAALRPLAPVFARARRLPAGIELTWIRRTRRDGDSWDVLEVPLSEGSEAYRVDIYSGATLKRRLATNMPQVLYPAADEIADFGSVQAALSVRIVQISQSIGDGTAHVATIPVRLSV